MDYYNWPRQNIPKTSAGRLQVAKNLLDAGFIGIYEAQSILDFDPSDYYVDWSQMQFIYDCLGPPVRCDEDVVQGKEGRWDREAVAGSGGEPYPAATYQNARQHSRDSEA